MKYEYTNRQLGSIFGFTDFLQQEEASFSIDSGLIKILWNRNEEPVPIQVDDLYFELQPNQVITTTYFQKVIYPEGSLPLTAFLFNREFYCISDHDSEVSCNGILFFGTQDIPLITIPTEQRRKFDLLREFILDEFKTRDKIQGDMLQMLLKRLIIICTRLAKEQLIVKSLNDGQIDVIRKFNVLVDRHFKTKRHVKEYADLLHKSPKTLSNLFASYNQKTPKQIIQERVALEAKRMLHFTDKQNQEIAYDLGFEDPGYFSRFFRKITGSTPSEYRGNLTLNSI